MKIFNNGNFMKKIVFLLAWCIVRSVHADGPPATMDSRVKTYIYNPQEVFPIVLHYGYHAHIDLQKNETVRDIVLGDPVGWQISIQGNKIFLQTVSKEAHTNMTLITNRRTYEFDLIARNEEREIEGRNGEKILVKDTDFDLAYSISFYYPEENSIVDNKQPEDAKKLSLEISDLISGKVNTNYVYSGDSEITPIAAFNDAKFTYLKFRDERFIPKIETTGSKKKKVQIFSYNGYIIINDIFSKVRLSSGRKVVFVTNKANLS